MLGILLTTWSHSKGQSSNTNIVTRITELKEFKVEQTRIDSLKQTGQKVDIAISIVKGSLDAEDKGKDIFTAFINEDFGFTQTILYTIKFNSKTEEIISIKSNKRE
jgi:galactitol-specific phosphotransferase system IIB component